MTRIAVRRTLDWPSRGTKVEVAFGTPRRTGRGAQAPWSCPIRFKGLWRDTPVFSIFGFDGLQAFELALGFAASLLRDDGEELRFGGARDLLPRVVSKRPARKNPNKTRP